MEIPFCQREKDLPSSYHLKSCLLKLMGPSQFSQQLHQSELFLLMVFVILYHEAPEPKTLECYPNWKGVTFRPKGLLIKGEENGKCCRKADGVRI